MPSMERLKTKRLALVLSLLGWGIFFAALSVEPSSPRATVVLLVIAAPVLWTGEQLRRDARPPATD